MKKSLSILLCLIIICTMIYIPSVEASIDLATFNSKLTAFKNERYGHGSIYQDNPNLTGGYQCFGYANELALYIWGSYPTKSMSAASVNSGWNVAYGGSAVDNLCIGDIVRYRYHSIFITGISGDTIYYCHANSPSGTNKVTYDNTIARSTLKSRVSEQLTSPNTTKTGWVAHYTNGLSPSIPEEPDTDETPGKPVFNNTKTTYTNEEEITFTWNNTSNTSYYNWYIDQYDANSEGYKGDHYVRLGHEDRVTSVTKKLPVGKYRVEVTAYNSKYYTDSDWYYFEVIDAYPGKPAFNNTKTTYTNEEEITFTWNNTSNTSYYNWYIDQYDVNSEGYSGDHYVRIGNALRIESVTKTLPIGKYRVHVVAYNSSHYKSSDMYYFEVIDAYPGKPSFNNTKTTYTNEEEITFTWNDTSNTSYYNWYIDQYDANSEGYSGDHYVRIGNEQRIKSVTRTLPIGKYRVHVVSYNEYYPYRHNSSDLYYFEVVEATSFTESIVTKKDSLYSVEITLHNFTTPYDILIVGYKGSQFVTMKRVPHNEQNSSYTLVGDIDKIKVMVWSDLSTLKPLCEVEEITSDKFIIE